MITKQENEYTFLNQSKTMNPSKSKNKEMGKLILIGCAIIITSIYCLSLDYKCPYYGIQSFIFNRTLGLELKPRFIDYYPPRFVFLDKDEYECIAKGFKYDRFEFKIDSIISYGYNNDSFLIVNCLDVNDSLHTLIVSDVMGKTTIENNYIFEKYGRKYDVSIDNIIGIRNRRNITFIILLVCLVVFCKQLKRYIALKS